MAFRHTFAALVAALTLTGAASAQTVSLYVSNAGNDNNSGRTTSAPFRTFEKALRTARELRADGQVPEMVIMPGRYFWPRAGMFAVDNGTPTNPFVVRAQTPGTAIIDGSRPVTRWMRLRGIEAVKIDRAARPFVWMAPLDARVFPNLGSHSPWQATNTEAQNVQPTEPEVFEGNTRLRLAEFPNNGYANSDAIAPSNTYEVPAMIVSVPGLKTPPAELARHAWFIGDHSRMFYNVLKEKIKSYDPATRTMSFELRGEWKGLGERHPELSQYNELNPQIIRRFKIVNSLYELDSPGEYYIDAQARQLYLWPINRDNLRNVQVSVADHPLIYIDSLENVRFQGLVFQRGRQDGLAIKNSRNIVVDSCTFTNLGNSGVRILNSYNVTVKRSSVSETGGTGIHFDAGDRETLTPSGGLVENNLITRFGRTIRTWRPGVYLNGVGVTVRNNTITEADHAGIFAKGNDHVIKSNVLKDLCLNSTDAGAITVGGDWTAVGTVVEDNYIENVRRGNLPSMYPNMGIYLDGLGTGVTVRRNIIRNADMGIDVLGGSFNTVEDNVIIGAYVGIKVHAMAQDASAQLSRHYLWAARVPWQSDVWRNRYPFLYDYLMHPDDNYRRRLHDVVVQRNVILDPGSPRSISQGFTDVLTVWVRQEEMPGEVTIANNLITDNDALFVNPAANDFRPAPNNPLRSIGFAPGQADQSGVNPDIVTGTPAEAAVLPRLRP